MRWPFTSWLRGAAGRDDPTPDEREAVAPGTDGPGGPGPAIEARPAAWRDVPPIEPVVGTSRMTAPSAEFALGLAGRRETELTRGALGHNVTADGPAGLAGGVATALIPRAPAGPGVLPATDLPAPLMPSRARPAARRTSTSAGRGPTNDGGRDAIEGSAFDAPDVGPPALPPAAEPNDEIAGLPLRTFPAVESSLADAAIVATRVADATAPASARALALPVAPGMPDAQSTGGPVPPSEGVQGGVDGSGPVQRPALADVGGPPAPAAGSDSMRDAGARRTLGESRRLGLGAPLVGPPPSTSAQLRPSSLPVARRARLAGEIPPTTAPAGSADRAPASTVVPAAGAASMPLPRLVVAQRLSTASVSGPRLPGSATPNPERQIAGQASAPAGEPVARDRGGDSEATRPLVGAAGIGSTRLSGDDSALGDVAVAAIESGADALLLARVSVGASVPAVEGVGAEPGSVLGGAEAAGTGSSPAMSGDADSIDADRAGTAARQAPVAAGVDGRSTTAQAALGSVPLVARRAGRFGPHEPLGALGLAGVTGPVPVVARRAGTTPGTEDGAAGAGRSAGSGQQPAAAPSRALQRETRQHADGTALATAPGSESRPAPALPLVRSAASAREPAVSDIEEAGGRVAWAPGSGFRRSTRAGDPIVQRAVTIDELSVAPSGGAAPGDGAGPVGQTGASQAGAGADYEELAEHVYEAIRARLASELLLDRERAGTLVDG